MKIIYLWVNDYYDHRDEIEQQLFYENQECKRFKLVLCYEESIVWEMGTK